MSIGPVPSKAGRIFGGMALLGLSGVAFTYVTAGATRFWGNYLVWFLFVLTIGLGSLFMVALDYLVGSVWSIPLRRVPERLASLLMVASVLAVLGLWSLKEVFPWTHHRVLAGKAIWLNIPFFSARVAACVGLWLFSYWLFIRGSLRQDVTKDPGFTVRAKKFAPIFMAIFALTVTVVAFDWISSLEPEWYSDIFGVYLFAGAFLAGLAASTLAILHLIDRGRLPGVKADHLYNLGGLLFAFTVFWAYIGFAQYMLIWYGNLPEEIFWFTARIDGSWRPVALLLAVLHFVVPFFALIARDAKSNPRRLRQVATVVLFAHLLDLYWLIVPATRQAGVALSPALSWPELSFALLFVGGGLLWTKFFLAQGADMPVGDPLLKQGLEFRL